MKKKYIQTKTGLVYRTSMLYNFGYNGTLCTYKEVNGGKDYYPDNHFIGEVLLNGNYIPIIKLNLSACEISSEFELE